MIIEQWIGKDTEGRIPGLICDTILAYVGGIEEYYNNRSQESLYEDWIWTRDLPNMKREW
jgi:hypothetical protein